MNRFAACTLTAALWLVAHVAAAAPINRIDPGLLTGTEVTTFDDVAGGASPGTNYNGLFVSGGVTYGERFVGQVRSTVGNADVLSGSPTANLKVQVGDANQNLNIFNYNGSQVLTGLGPLGFPNFDAIGEGSFAALFSTNQSEFGFSLVGGNGGSAVIDFFRRDGSLIERVLLSGLSDQSYAFSREGGVYDIAGISIYNDDDGGIGFDNLRFNVRSTGGDDNDVPEPGVFGLAALGLWAAVRRRRT